MMLSSSLCWKRKSKVSAKQIIIFLSLIIVAIAPLALQRQEGVQKKDANRSITIITSHNETIRREFGLAFSEWWAEKNNGEKVHINWVTPGGGAEVTKVIDTKFNAFLSGASKQKHVGLDVYFGGGSYAFNQAKKKDQLAELDIFHERQGLFLIDGSGHATIPQTRAGEDYYDNDHTWVGVCLSRFGICYNVDKLNELGLNPPKTWDDLTDPKYLKNIALADPTKSGSVNKAFEMILQQKMQEHRAEHISPMPGETKERFEARIRNEGWKEGLKLIQKITANTRYFTDSASKIPHDVANGNAAAGMCIDFYGRTYNEKYKKEDGSSRIQFIIPKGGSSVSVDPVAVFKHAEHPDLAHAFVRFCLTPHGQMLWNADPHWQQKFNYLGPKFHSLRRMPIRSDMYIPRYTQYFADQGDHPYDDKDVLTYKPELTAHTFDALRVIIRVMSIDTHDELVTAWESMIQSGFPKLAMDHHFHDLNKVSYTKATKDINVDLRAKDKMAIELRQQSLANQFRASYKKVLKNAQPSETSTSNKTQ